MTVFLNVLKKVTVNSATRYFLRSKFVNTHRSESSPVDAVELIDTFELWDGGGDIELLEDFESWP